MPAFFEKPTLNSPYSFPSRHWELVDGRPTDRVLSKRRSSELMTALPGASSSKARSHTPSMFATDELSTDGTEMNPSPVINRLRQELDAWRALPNPASWKVSPTTQRLLHHWRVLQGDEHQVIRPFFCQLEAVEAAIWLTEVAPELERGKDILRMLFKANNFALLPDGTPATARRPDLLRVAFKLATGAGKTTVMAMLIAWQAVNAHRSPNSKKYSNAFLIVTPGITIRDRLRVLQPADPDNYYENLNLLPRDMQEGLNRAKIAITNYHTFKLRERFDAAKGTRNALEGHGGALKTQETEGQMLQRALGDLAGQKNLVVINDEAHHCYRERPVSKTERLTGDDKKEAEANNEAARLWISGIEALNRAQNVSVVYDLSATPFFLKGSNWLEGTLFPWVMTDFSLMDAIECGIVKLPRVPVTDNLVDGRPVIYRDLWGAIGKKMPKKAKGETKPDPQKLPTELKTALDALYGHYKQTFELWEREDMSVPPVFIIVCNNTTNSEMLRDYVAGYEVEDDDGMVRVQRGALELFRNFNDDDDRVARPRTILIDSAALESGGEIDKAFKDAHAAEIEAFKRERLERGDGAADITDAEILREVMNTIGRKGRLGEQVRCVVSVSMLTEGWDANNVTHIMGLRAFGSRLICEQVIGRALRRMSYDPDPEPDPETGQKLFRTEYADIMGIDGLNFGEPKVTPPRPPREVIRVHAVSPERDALEITFPRVVGYRTDFPKERVDVDFSRLEPYVLTPERVGATEVKMSGIVGAPEMLDLEHLDDHRISTIAYRIASYWAMEKLRDPNHAPKPHLFQHARRIVLDWLASDKVICKDGTKLAQLQYRQLTDEVCDLLMGALMDQPSGEPIVRAVLDPFAPEGSTRDVGFTTSKESRHWPRPDRSHINWIVTDSNWENRFAQIVEDHPRVIAYAKNHALGFEVPYTSDGEAHRYRPDYLVRLDTPDPTTLVVEVKGYRGHDAMLKAQTMQNKWAPAVNRLGRFGRWGFAELRAVHDFRPDLETAIDALLAGEIAS